MEPAVKMTAQGVRDLNTQGPKKVAAAPGPTAETAPAPLPPGGPEAEKASGEKHPTPADEARSEAKTHRD